MVLFVILCSSLAYFFGITNLMWFLIFFGSGIAQLTYNHLRSLTIDPRGRAVIITGCDTGFGHSLAKKLHAMGFTVFACCFDLKCNGALKLQTVGKDTDRLHVIQLNVTSQKDVDKARQYVENRLPEYGLWAVVNNAGIAGNYSYLEWTSFEEFEKVASVNLFGAIRVTKAFLPLIRKKCGRIVNMSSIAGLSGDQFAGAYCITKFGIEAFSDVLRLEMKQFNVKVCIIEPGNFVSATSIITGENSLQNLGHHSWERLDETLRKDYGDECFERMLELGKILASFSAKDNGIVVDAMTDAISRVYPKHRYQPTIILYEKMLMLGGHFIPSFLTDFIKIHLHKVVYFLYHTKS